MLAVDISACSLANPVAEEMSIQSEPIGECAVEQIAVFGTRQRVASRSAGIESGGASFALSLR